MKKETIIKLIVDTIKAIRLCDKLYSDEHIAESIFNSLKSRGFICECALEEESETK